MQSFCSLEDRQASSATWATSSGQGVYARNYLIPQSWRAAPPTAIRSSRPGAPTWKGRRRKPLEAPGAGQNSCRQTVRITQKAGVDGRLFGSVTNADIAEALKQDGPAVVKSPGAHAAMVDQDRGRHPVSGATTATWWSGHRAGGGAGH